MFADTDPLTFFLTLINGSRPQKQVSCLLCCQQSKPVTWFVVSAATFHGAARGSSKFWLVAQVGNQEEDAVAG